MRRRFVAPVLVLLVTLAVAGLSANDSTAAGRKESAVAAAAPTVVGDLALRPCKVAARALCGSIKRSWDPLDRRLGTVSVGFAYLPARLRSKPAIGTLVPHEGGPGYSTTGSTSSYVQMYGQLLDRRNLLLVDQRGTGRSEPINCPALQDLKIAYRIAAGRCGRSLGARADDYSTARSADDLAAVIRKLDLGRVDVYGDSYGTFFAQVFTGRHGDQVRSLVLDSAYPTYGESAWYPTQTPAMRRAFGVVCQRTPACRKAGAGFVRTLERTLTAVRARPWSGVSHDADGRRMRVRVNAKNLAAVAFGATFGPVFYREMIAAMRSWLRGDRQPLLRLVAEATGGDTHAGNPVDYSEGLDAAVACHDYPQLYDMTASPGAIREQQYADALARRTANRPRTYAPFTVAEYAASDWQMLDWCTRWPTAPPSNPAGPPRPPGGSYPVLPDLVMSGELDSITTAAEGGIVADQFPRARHVVVRNSFHVTAVGDTDRCAVRIVRAFVRSPSSEPTGARRACAARVEPVRALAVFPRELENFMPATAGPTVPLGARRVGPGAAATVADVVDRWWNNYSGDGVGLRGGTWSYSGDARVRFRLHRVRLVRDLIVSGTAQWDRYDEKVAVDLRVRSRRLRGALHGGWDSRARGAVAVLGGTLGGQPVRLRFRAP